MPQVTHTAGSAAIDFLSGFGEGMVQNDINRREKENHEMQKQKWQQDMTAYAAQDELRKMQLENSRLEIDMRKTQFADLRATQEQTKGFTSFMFNSIGKATGSAADRQSQLFETYLLGSSQFPQADTKRVDMLIDTYSKMFAPAKQREGWEVVEVSDDRTGKKSKVVIDKIGNVINMLPGSVNTDDVNDITQSVIGQYNEDLDRELQAFMAGKSAVVAAESGLMSFEDFEASTEGDDELTKAKKAENWMFQIKERLQIEMHKRTGSLESRMTRALSSSITDPKLLEKYASGYADESPGVKSAIAMITEAPAAEQAEMVDAMEQEIGTLVPSYDGPALELALERLKNKLSLQAGSSQVKANAESQTMTQRTTIAKKEKEKEMIKSFFRTKAEDEGAVKSALNLWGNFLSGK